MILLLVLASICVAAEDLVEEPNQNCNCSRLLYEEITTTDPPPTFPTTSFTCWGRYDGYYADVEVDCTIFHYCQTWYFPTGLNETVKWDFACPQSTIFNQKILSCTPPNISFDCQESPNYYWVNWINVTEATTSATTEVPEYSTPDYNIGQQLIVGGLQPHEAPVLDSQENSNTHDNNESGSGHPPPSVQVQEAAVSFPNQLPNDFESGLGEPNELQEVISNSVNQVPEQSSEAAQTQENHSSETQGLISSGNPESVSEQHSTTSVELNNQNDSEAIHFPV